MAKPPADIFFATIAELSKRLRAKEFSTVELTKAFCDRLEETGSRYNALAHPMRKEALRKAHNIDAEIKRDRLKGPLQGIPYGTKDLLAVKGYPTAWGARPFAGQTFPDDAHVVAKLDKAGAILIGKLCMVELAGGPSYRFASASATGPGLNPWDQTRWSGGSSSGPGSAVAAGCVTFALGSETSGSILTPSAFCGVTGLRPTYGLVSRRGAMSLAWTMDKIGPMCRSVEDCALVLHEIAGGDNDDPGSAGKGFAYAPQFARKPQEITIGYAPVDFEEWSDPAARPAFEAALEVVKSLGVKLKVVEIPDFPYQALAGTIIGAEGSSAFEDLIRSGGVDQLNDARQIAGLKAGLEIPASEYLRAMRIRALVQVAFRKMYYDVDLLLTPSRSRPAPKISDPLDAASTRPPAKSRGLSGLIPAGNLAGLPAVSLPCGFADKMPVAISLVGRPFFENEMIAIGRAFQAQTDWHRRRPPAIT